MVAVSACSTDNTHLPALLDDPMASYQADGIVLVDAWEDAEGTEWLSGKPVHAKAVRTYRIPDQSQAEGILREAAAFAEAHDWRLTPPLTTPAAGYAGAKELTPGNARLGLSLGAADPLHDLEGPRVLNIWLDFGPVRFDDTTPSTPKGS